MKPLTHSQTKEAERIAEQLFSIHNGLIETHQKGLEPYSKDTRKLAKLIELFGVTSSEIISSGNSRGVMNSLLATL
jgi:hypothetical protein